MVVDYEAVKQIIDQYVSEVKAALPIDKVYLYGSYANGTARWDSDVDLCFFSDSFTSQDIMQVIGRLFEMKRRYNKYICLQPNAFPLSELNNDNPFVKEILRTGTEIYTRGENSLPSFPVELT
jgi:predicted nucleotidyltransferase